MAEVGSSDLPDPAAIAEEQRRLDRLRRTVDVTCALLRQAALTRREAEHLVAAARRDALELFPDKGEVFDLVIAPRLERILEERWPARPPRVLEFRPRRRDGER
ncbi:MAG TPA: hypothetical protein VMX54_00815 [Vicinamibacteria bacterium]|nr:hypothetical protein [Vicinamibacteria bacterium]